MIRVNMEFLNYLLKLREREGNDIISEKEAHAGEKIIRERSAVLAVYIIKGGLARCYLTEDTGKDFIQEFFGAGEVFGEIEMFNNELGFCTIQAITPLVYFKIGKKDFLRLIKKDALFNSLVLKLMASKIRYTALRHSYNQSHPLESNLKRLIGEFPELLEKIPKTDIANYLGITTRSLNRVLHNLEKG